MYLMIAACQCNIWPWQRVWPLQSCRELLPTASPWLLSDCAGSGRPIHIGPCLSNRPDQLDPCDMAGCQGRVAHHYWAMMTNITVAEPVTWDTAIWSRVLKDVFYVFNMLHLSTMHGLRKEFGWALHDTLFIPDKEDHLQISAWAAKLQPLKTFQQLEMLQPAWLCKRCRWVIPPPQKLFPMVQQLLLQYGPLKDASTHLPLFNQQNWKTGKQILELIRQGFVSDPPGIALYTVIGVDA